MGEPAGSPAASAPRIGAQLDGGDHRMQNVWIYAGDDQADGYRVQLPIRLATQLVAALNAGIGRGERL